MISPSQWPMHLDGCGSKAGSSPITGYAWTFDGSPARQHVRGRHERAVARRLTRSTLTVTTQDNDTATTTQDVVIRDLLIVSLGDSVASGEGNPDIAWISARSSRAASSRRRSRSSRSATARRSPVPRGRRCSSSRPTRTPRSRSSTSRAPAAGSSRSRARSSPRTRARCRTGTPRGSPRRAPFRRHDPRHRRRRDAERLHRDVERRHELDERARTSPRSTTHGNSPRRPRT